MEAEIKKDIKDVWNIYNSPEHIVHWNFASPDWHCPKSEVDLRVGGKFSSRMEAKDGSFGFDFEAIYDEVLQYKKIEYTMPDGRKVEITFESNGSSTKLVTLFDPETVHPPEVQKEGWQSILNNFKTYAESK
ncbi:MAG: activator of HSP90 ATPase [Spirochaetia bacterium]|nr:activator of HSP90 ATPase [Spirochaetia bacterium]